MRIFNIVAKRVLRLLPSFIRFQLVLFIWKMRPRGKRTVHVMGKQFQVSQLPFWSNFDGGWEPDTLKIFQKYLHHGRSFIDVGAFVGPTILYATVAGATKIDAIEADPFAFHQLELNCDYNKESLPPTNLHYLCIANKDGEKALMAADTPSSSGSSTVRHETALFQWQVKTICLTTFFKKIGFEGKGLVKIDIEGAESLILDDIQKIGNLKQTAVVLSLHPSFWSDKKQVTENIIRMTQSFDLFDIHGESLSPATLENMILTKEELPSWGTKWGNFFEIVLESKE